MMCNERGAAVKYVENTCSSIYVKDVILNAVHLLIFALLFRSNT